MAYHLLFIKLMRAYHMINQKTHNVKKHKASLKKLPKPALDFDRDKNEIYRPQDEAIDLSVAPVDYEEDIERPVAEGDKLRTQSNETLGVDEATASYIEGAKTHRADTTGYQTDEFPEKEI